MPSCSTNRRSVLAKLACSFPLGLTLTLASACGGRENGANAGTASGSSLGASAGSVLGTATGTTEEGSGSASVAGTATGAAGAEGGSGKASGSTTSTGIASGSTGDTTGGADSGTGSGASGFSSDAAIISCPYGQTLCDGSCVNEQTDSNNCGGCGLTCSVPCVAGRCIIALASTQDTPDGIAVDATSVYWRLGFADTIMKVSVNGGAPIKLGSGGQGGGPGNIALDGTSVYWTSSGGSGNVRKVSIIGGAVITLAGGPDIYSDGIAVDAVSVYWTGVGGGNGISVMKVPLDGGTVVTLASGQGTQGSDFPIAMDGRNLYWPVDTCPSDGGSCVETLQTMSVDGGTETTLASGVGDESIAVDSANVYCTGIVCPTDGGVCAGDLVQVPLVVGAASTILASAASPESPIAIDTTNVYYWTLETNLITGSLMRVPIGGGQPVTLAPGQPAPVRMAVDATSVYWTTWESKSGGAVMKLTPK